MWRFYNPASALLSSRYTDGLSNDVLLGKAAWTLKRVKWQCNMMTNEWIGGGYVQKQLNA
jgi:hypothetical protein